jgi:hypothetical protein
LFFHILFSGCSDLPIKLKSNKQEVWLLFIAIFIPAERILENLKSCKSQIWRFSAIKWDLGCSIENLLRRSRTAQPPPVGRVLAPR